MGKENDDFVGFAFVDDTDLVTANLKLAQLDIADIFNQAQETLNCW